MTLRSIHALLRTVILMGLPCVVLATAAAAAGKHVLELEDFDRLVSVEDPVCSQDGRWIAYIVDGADIEADERFGALWMTNYEGTYDLRLSAPGESASKPKFSPDGRYISYLSSREWTDTGRSICSTGRAALHGR